jgi:AP-3 complex subunit beta
MAVASLFYHLAPAAEAQKVAKSLVRISRSNREIQYVVLANIATMAATKPVRYLSCYSNFVRLCLKGLWLSFSLHPLILASVAI